MENPFEILLNKMNSMEQLINKLLQQQAATQQPNQPEDIGGMELAEQVTGLKRATIYCHINKNKIPHFKKGGRVYFSRQALLKWLTEDVRGKPKIKPVLPEVVFPRQIKSNHPKILKHA